MLLNSASLAHVFCDEEMVDKTWSADESRILTYGGDIAKLWDGENGELLFALPHDNPNSSASWNADESRILTYSNNDEVAKVWDGENGKQLFTMTHDGRIHQALWNVDESRILTYSGDGTAKVWDSENGELLFTLVHDEFVIDASWNADESKILTQSSDSTLKMWDGESGELLFTIKHNTYSNFPEPLWNTDKSLILTRSNDGTAKVWDEYSGELLNIIIGDGTLITKVWWQEDGNRVLVLTEGGLARQYYTHKNDLIAVVCQHITRNPSWEEWQLYFPNEPYHQTCSNLPPHSSVPEEALP